MTNIFKFPGNEQRQWDAISHQYIPFFEHLGATPLEMPSLLERTGSHWMRTTKAFNVSPNIDIPGPLRDEQSSAIEAALASVGSAVESFLKDANGATVLEFARLEFEIMRLTR